MRVLIAGASGLIGTVLWDALADECSLTGFDLRANRKRGVGRADVRRPRTLRRLLRNVDAVVDLASGANVDLPWEKVQQDIRGRLNLLDEARAHGVRRYVFASSNHATGMYEHDEPYASIVAGAYEGLDSTAVPLIGSDWLPRPDSPYGVGKVTAELLARYFAEQHSISCIGLRIGTVLKDDRPKTSRHYATLLTHADLIQLVRCALRAPLELRYGIYYGVSANTWRFWDLANAAQELGFSPQDDAERFRPVLNG